MSQGRLLAGTLEALSYMAMKPFFLVFFFSLTCAINVDQLASRLACSFMAKMIILLTNGVAIV